MFSIFKGKDLYHLGVDIGTTGIRLVELRRDGSRKILENYGHLESEDYLYIGAGFGEKKLAYNAYLSHEKIIKDLSEILNVMKVRAKKVSMSVPISAAFSSVITFPSISEGDIEKAINFEAKKYIPSPLEEVSFGWNIVSSSSNMKGGGDSKNVKVLLVAIQKDMAMKYYKIAKALNLNLVNLETESFPLARALVGEMKGVCTIVDIGSKATNITIVEDGAISTGHSVSNVGGLEITNVLAHGFNVDSKRAEILKRDIGLKFQGADKKVSEIIAPVVSVVISDVRKINESYSKNNQKKIDKIILTGGSANLPGIAEYFSKEFRLPVELGNPWKSVGHDERLSGKLSEISSQFAVAVGLALGGFK